MFQVPLWTSTKAREHPLWSLRALSPPVRCCLPAPFFLPSCGCPCVCVLFCPSLCCPPLLVPAAPDLRCFLCFLVLPCLVVVFLAFLCPRFGAPVCCPVLNLFLSFWVLVNYCGPWRPLLLPLVSGPSSVCVLFCRGLVCWVFGGGPSVLGLVSVFVWGSRTRPEPWTGQHCSEFHWRWPVELPALLSRAPASSKACTHGSFSTDPAALRRWYLCWVLNIFARCCDFLLTAWPVQHYCKQRWDDDTLTDLNSYAGPRWWTGCFWGYSLASATLG